MRTLKKTLVLQVLDREFSVDVDFRVIEVIERAFDLSADAVLMLFNDMRRVQRHKVAEAVIGLLTLQGSTGLKRSEIREAVMGAQIEQFGTYLTLLWAALAFALHQVDEKFFDELVEKATARPAEAEDEEGAKKKPRAPKKASSPPATG